MSWGDETGTHLVGKESYAVCGDVVTHVVHAWMARAHILKKGDKAGLVAVVRALATSMATRTDWLQLRA